MTSIRLTPRDRAALLLARADEATAPAFLRWVIALAWTATVLGHMTGWDELAGHDELLAGGFPPWLTLVLFLAGWLLMVAAMMLPSSLPQFQRFAGLVPAGAQPRPLLASFLGGYALVWTMFGAVALVGDGFLHSIVDGWPWLAARPWFLGGALLLVAGGFELFKPAEPCRTAGPTGTTPDGKHLVPTLATRMGADHGLQRLRRCWPLMLLSFAAGMTSLAWMAVLTVLMTLEGNERPGRVAGIPIGAGLLALGAVVLLNPAWLPALSLGAS